MYVYQAKGQTKETSWFFTWTTPLAARSEQVEFRLRQT